MTKGEWLIKLFGLPVIIGVILGLILPGFAFSFAPIASGLLFALLYVTLIDIDLMPKKMNSESILEGLSMITLSYLLIPILVVVVARLMSLEMRLETALILSAMAPFALVAPMFAHNCGGLARLSLWQVLLSMVLCPLLIPMMMMLTSEEMPVFVRPLVLYLTVISIGPYLLGLATQKLLPQLCVRITPYKSALASLLLAVLVYVLFGSAVHKWDASHSSLLIVAVILFHIISDFVLFYLSYYLFRRALGPERAVTYAATLGMKNMAIPAGLLLAYDPSMAFVPALGFVVHAFFFNFLGLGGKRLLSHEVRD